MTSPELFAETVRLIRSETPSGDRELTNDVLTVPVHFWTHDLQDETPKYEPEVTLCQIEEMLCFWDDKRVECAGHWPERWIRKELLVKDETRPLGFRCCKIQDMSGVWFQHDRRFYPVEFVEDKRLIAGRQLYQVETWYPSDDADFVEIGAAAPAHSRFMSASEFLQKPTSISWLIQGRIPQNSTGQIFGPSGGGKTFNALDISLAVAAGGHTLNGCRAEQGIVLYLAGEGHDGLRRRVKAWQTYHGKSVDELSRFFLSRNTITFNAPDILAAVSEGKALATQHGSNIALIAVDTLARHLEGDENSTRDMGEFIRAVDNLRNAFPGSVALIIHHSGHGEDTKTRARGSSALKGAMDFEIMCDKGLLTFTKLKDGEAPPPIEFKLEPVEIGTNETGEPVTSCIVRYGERSHKSRESSLTKTERILFELAKGCPDMPLETLKNAFFAKKKEREPDAKTASLTRAFQRALESLLDKGIITMQRLLINIGQSDMP